MRSTLYLFESLPMNFISGLPEVLLVSILMDWLTLNDFGRLDSAMCHQKSRVEVRKVISATQHAFADTWDSRKHPSGQWMAKHGVRCNSIRLKKELFLDSDLPEQLIMHSGPLLQSLQLILFHSGTGVLPEKNEQRSIDGILNLLSSYCKNLQKIHITTCYEHDLLKKDILSLHGLLCTNNSLHSLQLNAIQPVPMYLLELALTKLKFVSIEDCYVQETPTLQLHETDVNAHFKCVNTPLPKQLCAFVTELGLTRLEWNNHDRAQELIASYTKLSHVTVAAHHAEIGSFLAQCICQYWCKLVFLRFDSLKPIFEEITMMFIKQIPTLRLLDTTGCRESDITKHSTMHINTTTLPAASQLHTLCMYCDRASTLEEILQLCPQLTTLSLTQHQRSTVEQSLHLLRNSNVKNLYLSDYDALRNEDVAVLQGMPLTTLSISHAGNQLQDRALISLLPTLRLLHTLDLSYCTGLTHQLVMQVPPLCLTLRSYTFRRPRNPRGIDDSKSYLVLKELLPTVFPHLKEVFINC